MTRDYEKWHESKKELPPLGEVVEGFSQKLKQPFKRSYFALVEFKNEIVWMPPSIVSDYFLKKFEITHWRYIPSNPNGKKPFIKVMHYKRWWSPKVFWQ